MLASICLLAMAGPSALTYREPASSLGVMVHALAARTGKPMIAHPDIAKEVVFLRVKDASLDEVKARLARVLHGEWVETKDGDRIQRSPQHVKEIWEEHVALRRKLVDETYGRVLKELEASFNARALANGLLALKPSAGPSDVEYARRYRQAEQNLFRSSPVNRLLRRLLLGCRPDELAGIGMRERRVFTVNPTKMQGRINLRQFQRAIAEFTKEQNDWVAVARDISFPADDGGRLVSDPRSQFNVPAQGGDKIRLIVRRGEQAGLFMVNLEGDTGREWGVGVISQESFANSMRSFLNDGPTAIPGDKDVELSNDAKLVAEHFSKVFDQNAPIPGQELTKLLLNVDQHEPQSWITSDVLSAYAELEGKNLVASLTDTSFNVLAFLTRSGMPKVRSAMQALVNSGELAKAEQTGWIELSPVDRWEASIDFSPRKPSADFLRKTWSKGRVDVRDLATYAFDSGRLFRGGIGENFLMLLDRGLLSYSDQTDWNALRLYGSLSPKEQMEFESGKRLPYSGMRSALKRIVDRIVYADSIRSEVVLSRNSRQISRATPVEPTEAYPSGVPNSAYVDCTTKVIPMIVAYGKKSDGRILPLRTVDPWTLANIELKVKGNESEMRRYGMFGFVGYAPAQDKVLGVRVVLEPDVWTLGSITIPEFGENVKPVPWEQLPEPHRTEVAQSMEQLREQMKRETGGVPPPRR